MFRGMTARATAHNRIRLAPGSQVQVKRLRDCHVLVHPTGTVQLNASAAALLALCDGTRTREEIIAHILPRARDPDLAVDVRGFLDVARERGWIIES
jgi:pyrroloquinoline quinone biosynthesis protein D